MRTPNCTVLTGLLVAALFFAAGPAHAAVKCVDAAGNVTYTDPPCPANTTSESAVGTRPAQRTRAQEPAAGQQPTVAQRFDEVMEAKRRELQGKCDAGDRKSCADVVCLRMLRAGVEAQDYRACADAHGFKSTSDWAQVSERSDYADTRVQVVCLKNPEEVVLLDKPVKAFRHLNLISHHSASATRAANRFSESSFPGDYASWEEAANALCARERTR